MLKPRLNLILSVSLFLTVSCVSACSKGKDSTTTNPPPPPVVADTSNIQVWLTDPNGSILFQPITNRLVYGTPASNASVIQVDDTQTFQTIDGFGYTLTGGSAELISNMSADTRAALLQELFAYDKNNIGTSYLRISIGSSDLDDHVFSYDDLAPGTQQDTTLAGFDLGQDKKWLIPVLKQILAINPTIKILGSPWSPPAWMKSNNSTQAGSLLTKYYNAYANYFVKYINAMKAQGITIDAITIQNEPLNPGNNPSMVMQPDEQAAFIKTALGPVFAANSITTKIILYDHNADRADYPTTILSDADAAKYVDGSAFHLYGGNISALNGVHNAYPNKNLYFTEQWVGAPGNMLGDLDWHIQNVIIGSVNNWCKVALEWNLASDPALSIHTPGGCTQCLGAVTISTNTVSRNPAYYIIAHAAKFVRPGSIRISSNTAASLPNAAFKTPDGKTVLLVENTSSGIINFAIGVGSKKALATLNPGAVATYVW